ncbi:MAG: hypothetical protein ABIK45_01730 [Pseudomonadota bacterium]
MSIPKAHPMKIPIIALCLILFFGAYSVEANDNMHFVDMGNGWTGLTRQSDPFDTSKYTIIQMYKGAFTFRCNECNFTTGSWGYDGLSFGADIKYIRGCTR